MILPKIIFVLFFFLPVALLVAAGKNQEGPEAQKVRTVEQGLFHATSLTKDEKKEIRKALFEVHEPPEAQLFAAQKETEKDEAYCFVDAGKAPTQATALAHTVLSYAATGISRLKKAYDKSILFKELAGQNPDEKIILKCIEESPELFFLKGDSPNEIGLPCTAFDLIRKQSPKNTVTFLQAFLKKHGQNLLQEEEESTYLWNLAVGTNDLDFCFLLFENKVPLRPDDFHRIKAMGDRILEKAQEEYNQKKRTGMDLKQAQVSRAKVKESVAYFFGLIFKK